MHENLPRHRTRRGWQRTGKQARKRAEMYFRFRRRARERDDALVDGEPVPKVCLP